VTRRHWQDIKCWQRTPSAGTPSAELPRSSGCHAAPPAPLALGDAPAGDATSWIAACSRSHWLLPCTDSRRCGGDRLRDRLCCAAASSSSLQTMPTSWAHKLQEYTAGSAAFQPVPTQAIRCRLIVGLHTWQAQVSVGCAAGLPGQLLPAACPGAAPAAGPAARMRTAQANAPPGHAELEFHRYFSKALGQDHIQCQGMAYSMHRQPSA
jgi:hypothetical protein